MTWRACGDVAGVSGWNFSGPVLPSKASDLINFVAAREEGWEDNLVALNIPPARIAALKAALAKAQASEAAQIKAKAAALAATTEYNTNTRLLRVEAAACVRDIETTARNSSNPGATYALGQIPAPKEPGTAPPPAQPRDLTAQIDSDGALTIKWKCSNPRGISNVVYQVKRRLNTGAFVLLDVVGEKQFVDATIPAGTRSVAYIVTGKRGQQSGPQSALFTVQFGVEGGGGMFIADQFSQETQLKGKAAA
ncbi:MAG TPA: hypothetical protein VD997_09240 [Phycisphaerales bacterium]|nr:hypothetical protein [Phycisphaerales bacterium]